MIMRHIKWVTLAVVVAATTVMAQDPAATAPASTPASASAPALASVDWRPTVASAPAPASAPAKAWDVSTVEQLRQALKQCGPGDQVVLAPGRYFLEQPIFVTQPRVVVRGRTGRPEDVVLHGGGMNNPEGGQNGVHLAAHGVQLRDLTVRDFYQYGVLTSGREPCRFLPDGLVLSNLRIEDCGTRHIKGVNNRDTSDAALIERVQFRQTQPRQSRPGHPVDPDNYIGGIDAMRTRDWIIRDCRFEGIRGATGGGRGAIFLWIGSANPLIERNVFVDCAAAICLGNGHNPDRVYHVTGGVVRNNVVRHRSGWRAIELGFVRDLQFVHNTIYSNSGEGDDGEGRTVDCYDGRDLPAVNVQIRNNLIRGRVANRARGQVLVADNVTGPVVTADWFEGPDAALLRLTPKAERAIDRCPPLEAAPLDFDGRRRPAEGKVDAGAFERP